MKGAFHCKGKLQVLCATSCSKGFPLFVSKKEKKKSSVCEVFLLVFLLSRLAMAGLVLAVWDGL
jgi:hypothetical protein